MADRRDATLTLAGGVRGARTILPLCTFVFALAATFGMAARQADLSAGLATLMSAVLFAGGAQFAALGLLGPPPLMGPLLLATFAINARHLLLGASLAPWLASLPLWQRLGSVTVLSDVNWAQAMRAHASGERDAGVLVGAGLMMWIVWVVGTWFGAAAAQTVPDIRRFGLDALMLGFFAAALADGWRGRGDLPAAAGAVAITVIAGVLGAREWSVIAGAVAGAAVGTWSDENAR